MSRYLVIPLLLCFLQQAWSTRVASEEEEEADGSFTPWNEFQQNYKGCGLFPSQFTVLFRWPRRAEMEYAFQNPCDIVEIFKEESRPDEDQIASTVDIGKYAQVLPLPKDVRAEDLSDVVGSPFTIARTLYSVLITHLPKADISSEWQEDGHRPIAEFLSKLRVGDKEHPGLESCIREWIEELHKLTMMHFDASNEGIGERLKNKLVDKLGQINASNESIGGRLKNKLVDKLGQDSKNKKAKDAVKEGLKYWVDRVIHDLESLAGQPAEVALISYVAPHIRLDRLTHWRAEVDALYRRLLISYSEGALDQPLVSSVSINKTQTDDNWWEAVTMFVTFNMDGYKPKARTERQHLHSLADAYKHGVISDEHDLILATIDDLRVCFVELLRKLEWVRDHFHLWTYDALQGRKGPPLQQASFEWAQNSWDSFGLVIPGDESPESRRLGTLSGTLLLEKLESLDSAAPGFLLDSMARIPVQRMLFFNVAEVLAGAALLWFMQMREDAGPSLKLMINAKEIPFFVPSSAKTFAFDKVSDMSLYQPGLEAATNLSTDLTATGSWYVCSFRMGSPGLIKSFLESIASGQAVLSNPSAAAVFDSNGEVIAEPAFVEKVTVETFARLALGSSEKGK